MLVALTLTACAGPPRAASPSRSPEPADAHEAVDEAVVEEVEIDAPAAEIEPSPSALPCDEVPPEVCGAERPRCVWDPPTRRCRDPHDACEAVVPQPSWQGRPLFEGRDPCENVDPRCAWSQSARRCVPFVAVPACPPSLDEVGGTEILCHHSSQPALECRYGATRCACGAPPRCGGGRAPDPSQRAPAASFTCVPPFDDRGCPMAGARQGRACRVDPDVVCMTCQTSARCVRGRWQVRPLGPRP